MDGNVHVEVEGQLDDGDYEETDAADEQTDDANADDDAEQKTRTDLWQQTLQVYICIIMRVY